jgi:phage terminase small subunit
MAADGKLTDKQKRFCEEYLIDLNATQSAIRAGYSKATAGAIGSENLTKPEIRAYIENAQKERSERTLVDADFVISGLKEVSLRCMANKPVMDWDYEDKCLKHRQAIIMDEEGKTKEVGVYEFDSSGANRSLELLGKHLGIFEKDNKQQGKEITVNII